MGGKTAAWRTRYETCDSRYLRRMAYAAINPSGPRAIDFEACAQRPSPVSGM